MKRLFRYTASVKSCIEEYYGLPEEDGWKTDYFYSDEYGTAIVYTRETVRIGNKVGAWKSVKSIQFK